VNYIVSVTDGLYCFYHKSGSLLWREYLNGAWSAPSAFKEDGVINFTVSLCEGKILIICRSLARVESAFFEPGTMKADFFDRGDFEKRGFGRGDFRVKTLVEGGLEGQYYGLSMEDDIFLVHNIPVNGEYSQILMSHRVALGGLWADNRHLGRIIPLTKSHPFEVIPISNQHFLLVYQTGGGAFGGDLGYREVFGRMVGDFNIIQPAAKLNLSSSSFLATNYAVHMVYINKGLLVPSLIYRRKDGRGLSSKVTVASGHNIHSPLLYMSRGTLNLLFMRGDDVFTCSLDGIENPGASPTIKHESQKSNNIILSHFLCENRSEDGFFANKLPVDSHRPWEIQFFKDLVEPRNQPHSFREISREASREEPILRAAQIGSQEDYDNFFNEDFE
jgi:hypothetical protein